MNNHLSNTQHSSIKIFDNQNLLTTEQLSELLQVSEKTIRDWVYKRKIPFKRVGRLIRFCKSEITAWINRKE